MLTDRQDFVPEGFWHKEIAVIITPVSSHLISSHLIVSHHLPCHQVTITPVGVFKGDRGMIIVAGSTGHELTCPGPRGA